MSRSRARKNRNKYKTLRKLGVFKIFVMDYPNRNRRVYPALNFGTMKFDKELIHEINHPQGSFISISSRMDEGYSNIWDTGLKHAQEANDNGENFYPTVEPQATSAMEHNIDIMCAVMGVSRENLKINSPSLFASSVDESVRNAIKMEHDIKRERFRGPAISKLHGGDDLSWAISPWSTKMNFAGIWSNPVDTSNLQGPNIEELRIEDLVHRAKHVISENTRQHINAIAESIGEDIEVDTFLLRDEIKVFRQQNNVYDLIPIDYDSREWAIVIIALHRRPDILDHLKAKGYDFIHIQRGSKDETIVDTYHVIDIANDKDVETFKPFRVEHSVDFTTAEIVGDDINKFAARIVGNNILSWDMVKDR